MRLSRSKKPHTKEVYYVFKKEKAFDMGACLYMRNARRGDRRNKPYAV